MNALRNGGISALLGIMTALAPPAGSLPAPRGAVAAHLGRPSARARVVVRLDYILWYDWLPDGRLLAFRHSDGAVFVFRPGRRHRTTLRRLSRALVRWSCALDAVSPSGKWLLCRNDTVGRGWVVLDWDGDIVGQGEGWLGAIWLRDGKHWMTTGLDRGPGFPVTIHPARHGRARLFRVRGSYGYPIGVNRSGVVAIADEPWDIRDPPRRVSIVRYRPERAAVTQLARVQIPAGAVLVGAALSPRGNQIAWLLGRPRLNSPRHGSGITTTSIWLSKVNGADLRQVYDFTRAGQRLPPGGEDPDLLRWSPDGRRLSFMVAGSDVSAIRLGSD